MNAHPAGDEHACRNKSDCCETCDSAIPKQSAKCFVNREAITVDSTAFAKRKDAGHGQNHNQIEPVTKNDRRRAQRAPIDMQFRLEERDCQLFQELSYKNNCRDENQKSLAVAKTIRADEDRFEFIHWRLQRR